MENLKPKEEIINNILECCVNISVQLIEIKKMVVELRDDENHLSLGKAALIERSSILIHTYMRLILVNCGCLKRLDEMR